MKVDAEKGQVPTHEDSELNGSVGFFDSRIDAVKRRVYFQWARTVLLLSLVILGAMSLFWASQFGVSGRMGNLTVWVVDFDGQITPELGSDNPIVGPTVVNVTKSLSRSTSQGLSYEIQSPATFDNDPRELRQAVYDEKVYAAVIVSPNATRTLLNAVRNGESSYNPEQAGQFVTISARDQTTYPNYIDPSLNNFEREVISYFGPFWVEWLAKHENSSLEALGTDALQTVNSGISFERVDLRPFSPVIAVPAVTVGLIYLIILSFFIFPFLMPVHMQLLKGNHPSLKISHWVFWRILSNILAYLILSFCYSLVSLAFQIPFQNDPAPATESALNANAYGKGSFVVFWMLNWIGMAALGLPCENMAMILGAPYSSFFLIFWVISNVSTGFYALDLAPSFFRWGYAWPLHRSKLLHETLFEDHLFSLLTFMSFLVVEALRTILFGTHSRIGLDFGILLAWVGVSIAFYPFATHVMQLKQKHGIQGQRAPSKKG